MWLTGADILGERITERNARTYVRDPHGVLPVHTQVPFEVGAAPPSGAVDTGLRYAEGELELWVVPSQDAFVLVRRGDVWERWPRAAKPFGCG